jgi:hypothetical protein
MLCWFKARVCQGSSTNTATVCDAAFIFIVCTRDTSQSSSPQLTSCNPDSAHISIVRRRKISIMRNVLLKPHCACTSSVLGGPARVPRAVSSSSSRSSSSLHQQQRSRWLRVQATGVRLTVDARISHRSMHAALKTEEPPSLPSLLHRCWGTCAQTERQQQWQADYSQGLGSQLHWEAGGRVSSG